MQPGTAGNCAMARLQAAAVLHWNIHFCNGGNLANFNGSKRKKRWKTRRIKRFGFNGGARKKCGVAASI
jgi:hypothetical protein